MSIFHYQDVEHLQDHNDALFIRFCKYCGEELRCREIEDVWKISNEEILSINEGNKIIFRELYELRDPEITLVIDSRNTYTSLRYCNTCGWWHICQQIEVDSEGSQIWDFFWRCSRVLKKLDVNDINTPLNEVSSYLLAKYECRFDVNPRLFENIVASVFREFGYHVHVTGYSNDGGIDVVLKNSEENLIGVQVKRHKSKIKVEQIRAFAGALMLSGHTQGIFVTTSDYQPGAIKAAKSFSHQAFPIRLLNSKKLYEALKIAKRNRIDVNEIKEIVNKDNIPNLFSYGWQLHRNTI